MLSLKKFLNFVLLQQWYVLSKTLAEEAAWKFSKDNELEIVVMHPTMVIGPLLQPTLNASVEVILNLINGMWFDPFFVLFSK